MTVLKTTDDLAIPLGSLILITGATGFIGANVVYETLQAGFKVRGTVRSQEKADNTIKMFGNNPDYEPFIVADMSVENAFDEAVKGVDAVMHVASDVSFNPDPKKIIAPTVQAATGIMKSALKESSIKRFVYTSSSTAATYPTVNQKFHLDRNKWNTEVDQYLDLEPPFSEEMGMMVYGASKTKAEEAVWKFVKDNKPHFVVNTVLPNLNMGRILGSPGATGGLVPLTYNNKPPYFVPPQYMIDVIDDARIHLAATFDKTLANERIYAFDTSFTWNDVLKVLSEIRPNKKFVEPKADEGRDTTTVDNELGAQLLKKWWGQDGYTGLKKSVEQNIVQEE